ncbi:hypothetical protein NM688_g1694 [Phlebia brevispora]|uniref:Uncharacterized protein n=1 Tax=Phlebia brevispora TaxID=194682 RepID=A0ACC1TAS3_9APHY|nr:hypothetical protein NM688_g1694 [Phlebia brevispora]
MASLSTVWQRLCDNQGGDPQTWRDAIAAAITGDSKWIITSSNSSFVPAPVLGPVMVSIEADGHFGTADLVHWPQVLQEDTCYPWLACVERHPLVVRYPRSYLWSTLSNAQISPVQSTSLTALATVQQDYLRHLREIHDRIKFTVESFERFKKTQNLELRWLYIFMRDALERLDFPATYRDLIRQHACFQRFALYVDAWFQWHVTVKGTYQFSLIIPLPRDSMMGAFVTAPAAAQMYFEHRVPVWFLRTQPFFKGDEIVKSIVAFSQPPTHFSFADANDLQLLEKELVGRVFASIDAGEHHLDWIHRQLARYVDLESRPYPEVITWPDSQLHTGICTSALSNLTEVQSTNSKSADSTTTATSKGKGSVAKKATYSNANSGPQSSSNARFQPYPSRNIVPSEKEKYQPFFDEYLARPISSWQDALAQVKLGAFLGEEPWRFWLPDLRILVHTKQDDCRVRYIKNWLRLRNVWFALLLDNLIVDGAIGPLRIPQWRDYLNTSEISEAELTKNGKRPRELREVSAIFKKVFKNDVLSVQVPSTWHSVDITTFQGPTFVALCQQITWELSEVGFQYELTRLDQHLLPGDSDLFEGTHRQDLIAAVFPRYRTLIPSDLPAANDGLAATKLDERAEYLQALKRTISRWPNVPDRIRTMTPFKSVNDAGRFAEMERALVGCYCQIFYEVAGRPPMILRILYK